VNNRTKNNKEISHTQRTNTESWLCRHPQTRNTFCCTWYLPHSQVYNDRTVLI